MDKETIQQMKVTELRDKLRELQLSITGRKATLQDRLFEHFNIAIGDEDEDNELSFYEETIQQNDQNNDNTPNFSGYTQNNPTKIVERDNHNETLNKNYPYHQRMFTLQDIRESINQFDGAKHPGIGRWLEEFDEISYSVNWDNVQKFIYAKQLLIGPPKIFIRSQPHITDWIKLRKALLHEFGKETASIDIHKKLQNRIKKENETYLEYMYSILEIGPDLDEKSIIEHFIDGIRDRNPNKHILYGANNIEELKAKIETYEKVVTAENRNKPNFNFKNRFNNNLRCTECPHLSNHDTKNCKKLGNTCYNCGKRGHKSAECRSKTFKEDSNQSYNRNRQNYNQNFNAGPSTSNHLSRQNQFQPKPSSQPLNQFQRNQTQKSENQNNEVKSVVRLANTNILLYKQVSIQGVNFSTLIDTGSEVCLITKSVFDKFKNTKLVPHVLNISGVGQGSFNTLGYFIAKIKIDNAEFEWNFHVANDQDIMNLSLIGSDILRMVDINLNSQGATFKTKHTEHEKTINSKQNEQESDTECENKLTIGVEFKTICSLVSTNFIEENSLDLPPEQKQKLTNIIQNYQPISAKKESPVSMKIILKDDEPVRQGPRRLPLVHQKIVEDQVSDWIKAGICKASCSEFASPIVLVSKKNGSHRLCCDYRKLNEKIVKDNFPMVLIDDALSKLQNAKIFTTLDLRNGFFHVPIDKDSQKFTAFITHHGHFEFLKVPFGISNSPAVFCRYIAAVFQELIQDNTIVTYMDDVIIPSQSVEENLEKLEKFLSIAEEYAIDINWKKCQFVKKDIFLLGYHIQNSTISPSQTKVEAIRNYKEPKEVKSLQRFLGLTSYLRRFISNYALIAKPLTDLLSKDKKFKFDDNQKLAFEELKQALCSAPVLKLFNPSAITELHTDASKFGYGGVILQKDSEDQSLHPVEYMSRKTTTQEENYSSYELEVLAIINALKKWRVYLLGMTFKLVTDCNAFTQTIKKKDIPARVARWVMYLQDFTFTVEHRAGTRLRHVDALSRVHALMIRSSLKHAIITAQQSDEFINVIKKLLQSENQTYKDYYVKYDILFKDPNKELIVVPESMDREVIELAHRQGHFAVKKTIELVQKNFYIKNIEKKVSKYVQSCIECILINQKQGKKEGFLNAIDKSDKPLETYHIDHVGPLENTKKMYNHILVVIDAFSKFVWLYPTKSTGSEEVVAKLTKQAEIFGNPHRIISDRGTAFTSHAFQDFCTQYGIQHQLITTGVPRGNGQVERAHKIVISILSKLCLQDTQVWYKHIGLVQQIMNNIPTRSTKLSPFKILTGLDMRCKNLPNIKEILESEELKELNENREEMREIAKDNIRKIQEENKKSYNKNRKPENEYAINDLIAIKRTQFGNGLKLKPKYLGPYKIIKRLRKGRYMVEKLGEGEGPNHTTTVAEFIKPWMDPRADP